MGGQCPGTPIKNHSQEQCSILKCNFGENILKIK